MKIAVLSDIHDHIDNLRKVLGQIKGNVDAVIFCGDMVSPFTTGILAETNLSTYSVLGNNDEDQIGMQKMGGKKFTWFHLSQEYGEVELDSRKIAFCHYPKLAELLTESKKYDAVFHGHTHRSKNETFKNTLLVNPGAVCGINFKSRGYGQASYAIYDTKTNSAKIIKI